MRFAPLSWNGGEDGKKRVGLEKACQSCMLSEVFSDGSMVPARASQAGTHGSGEGHLESGSTEWGLIHPNVAAIAVYDFGHHREAYALTGGTVSPDSALEDLF